MTIDPGVALSTLEPQAGDDDRDRPRIGQRLGRYQLTGVVGSGGMGDVFRAHDTLLGRDVALKVVQYRIVGDPGRARFVREARSIAMLSHPNVLAIYDVGDDAGVPYLVTELLVGETLRDRLRQGRPTVAQAVSWAAQVARGMAAAHERGIVHRDLKPENLFVVATGQVKILDFGLARGPAATYRAGVDSGDFPADGIGENRSGAAVDGVARTLSIPGQILGTFGYLAPEQARAEPVTAAADLFALGAILYEMLTGERAFGGATTADRLSAVLAHDPPPPSSLRPEVPTWLDQVVARCLAKDVPARFESARDLAFVLEVPPGGVLAVSPHPARGWRWPVFAVTAAAAAAVAVAVIALRRPAPRPPDGHVVPARSFPLTYSGRDRHPAASPDGRFLAFTSDRDGRTRIWLQQLDTGRETTLTEGPDHAPRFSPDGNQILFTRTDGASSALYRVALLGGDVRKVADNASDGDWSPDGRQVVFVRSRDDGARIEPSLIVAGADGEGERELVRLTGRSTRGRGVEQRVRWSPDGRRIAVSGFLLNPGMHQHVMIVPIDGTPPTTLDAPSRVGLLSAVAWEDAETIVYSQSLSVSGNSAGSAAQIVRQRLTDGAITTLLWPPESSLVLDRWPGRGIVYDVRSARTNLREIAIAGGASRVLSQGTSTDRQPCFAPGGDRVIFTSNRGTNLDVWTLDRATGASQRLTDHPGEDWDPAFTPDGRHLLWSSDRSGTFEIWIADADGANPRQVSRDGFDAENPTATADGQWIIYVSSAPGRAGAWRVRPDGTDAIRLVPDVVLAEVSPDSRYLLFQTNRSAALAVVGVATVAEGRVLPFEIRIEVRAQGQAVLGRARWMPDGNAIAFVGQDPSGTTGVFVQAFSPDQDTSATRTPLAGFDRGRSTESFDVDGTHVILAESDRRSDIMAATGLAPAR